MIGRQKKEAFVELRTNEPQRKSNVLLQSIRGNLIYLKAPDQSNSSHEHSYLSSLAINYAPFDFDLI